MQSVVLRDSFFLSERTTFRGSRYENVLARWRPGNEQEAAAKSAAVRLGKGRKMIGGEREREDKGGNVLARKKGCGYVAYKERI